VREVGPRRAGFCGGSGEGVKIAGRGPDGSGGFGGADIPRGGGEGRQGGVSVGGGGPRRRGHLQLGEDTGGLLIREEDGGAGVEGVCQAGESGPAYPAGAGEAGGVAGGGAGGGDNGGSGGGRQAWGEVDGGVGAERHDTATGEYAPRKDPGGEAGEPQSNGYQADFGCGQHGIFLPRQAYGPIAGEDHP